VQQLLTSFDGRIGRGDWWKGTIVMVIAAIVLSILFATVFGPTTFLGRLLSFLLGIVLLYPSFALGSKRLHDRGKPMLPWMAIFVGPSVLLNIMFSLGIGFHHVEMMGQVAQVPGTFAGLVSAVATICGLWGLVELGILKGTQGQNAFGADPVA
jgi:uncharacterized membrane protein YhaH (DUF805 family)